MTGCNFLVPTILEFKCLTRAQSTDDITFFLFLGVDFAIGIHELERGNRLWNAFSDGASEDGSVVEFLSAFSVEQQVVPVLHFSLLMMVFFQLSLEHAVFLSFSELAFVDVSVFQGKFSLSVVLEIVESSVILFSCGVLSAFDELAIYKGCIIDFVSIRKLKHYVHIAVELSIFKRSCVLVPVAGRLCGESPAGVCSKPYKGSNVVPKSSCYVLDYEF